MALCGLILLNVVDQHLQPAADAAVVQVESEAPDLNRLAAAFVLANVDAGIELMEDLIVSREERLLEDFGI